MKLEEEGEALGIQEETSRSRNLLNSPLFFGKKVSALTIMHVDLSSFHFGGF